MASAVDVANLQWMSGAFPLPSCGQDLVAPREKRREVHWKRNAMPPLDPNGEPCLALTQEFAAGNSVKEDRAA